MDNIGRLPIGRLGRDEKNTRLNAVRKAEVHRDEARNKLMAIRMRLKRKVEKNERKTDSRKKKHATKNLNPSVVSFMPSRKSHVGKNVSTAWSAVPSKPRYSSVQPKKRLYGRRFEAIDAGNKPRRL